MLRLGLAQERVGRDRYAAVMHWCIVSSIVVLTIVTIQVAIEEDTPFKILHGPYYLFFSLYGDLFGVVGCGMAFWRRYVVRRPARITWDKRFQDDLILLGLALILLTGFILEGARIGVTELSEHPEWAPWSFGGYALAKAFTAAGLGGAQLLAVHTVTWWFHLILAIGWLALIAFTKLGHLFYAPVNAYLRRTSAPDAWSRSNSPRTAKCSAWDASRISPGSSSSNSMRAFAADGARPCVQGQASGVTSTTRRGSRRTAPSRWSEASSPMSPCGHAARAERA